MRTTPRIARRLTAGEICRLENQRAALARKLEGASVILAFAAAVLAAVALFSLAA
jgi:hypothetical protein